MPWRIVQQPDGLFARFSTIVDMFTDYDMTYDEALEVCLEEMGRRYAPGKIQSGIDAGNERWLDELDTIKVVHGKKYYNMVIRAIVDKDPEAQEWLTKH